MSSSANPRVAPPHAAPANEAVSAWDDPHELAAAQAAGAAEDPLADDALERTWKLAQGHCEPHADDLDPSGDAAFWRALGQLGQATPDERSDDDLAAAVLTAYRQQGAPIAIDRATSRSRRALWVWTSIAAAAGVALLLSVSSGDGVPLASRLEKAWLHLALRDGVDQGDSGVAVQRHVEIPLHKSENRAVERPNPVPPPVLVPVEPMVVPPAVPPTLAPPNRARAALVPTASADELLQEAQRARAAGDDRQAQAVYRKLLRQHPQSAEARLALVSLGRMELQDGAAKPALRHFEQYLQLEGEGPLAQEARDGKIRALQTLGRRDEEAAAIVDFLERYPGSAVRARLTQRLDEVKKAR